MVKVQVLYIDACPNWIEAVERTRAALDATGLAGTEVESVLVHTEAEAAAAVFGGSPTVLVDGEDLFPGARTSDLACRVYFTEVGTAGMPSGQQLEEALHRRAT